MSNEKLKFKKSVLTVSVGTEYYHSLTRTLIKSFLIHNKNEIVFNLLTDNPKFFSEFVNEINVFIQDLNISDKDKSFTSKFYMYDKIIANENLFIDCDCIIFQDLNHIFDLFANRNFSAIGTQQKNGDFFCNIESIVKKFNIPSLPVFVGSVYYFKQGQIAANIFKKATQLKSDYDHYGFIRLRGKENEEPLIAVAMSLYGETTLQNTSIKADAMFYKRINSNVIRGKNDLLAIQNNFNIKDTYANESVRNIPIIHFNASFSDGWNYKLEQFRLKNIHLPQNLVDIAGQMGIKYPAILKIWTKEILRPIYRSIFGFRKVSTSKRLK
ncbi:hypothetical protein [Pedobacter sp. ASV28]|uniref:hypothetical protein n=1 Tax=Pedobacter sp. ASV28 TaxID=2795123 RepID=UPI0018EAE50E|nr:hypothetical protein [Pedobacter sp. ASV28]